MIAWVVVYLALKSKYDGYNVLIEVLYFKNKDKLSYLWAIRNPVMDQ